jgi:hypothetical protein
MNICHNTISKWIPCIAVSFLAHLLFLYSLRACGSYDFAAPVNAIQVIMVEMAKPKESTLAVIEPVRQEDENTSKDAENSGNNASNAPVERTGASTSQMAPGQDQPEAAPQKTDLINKSETVEISTNSKAASDAVPIAPRNAIIAKTVTPPPRKADEFLATKSEKLFYQISMFGIPVGSTELEAKNENGEIRITLRTRSNSFISGIYPVNDIVETRHIGGNSILTTIKQQEGAFRSDIGIVLMLREKSVLWIDHIKNRSSRESVPVSDVLDTLSGIYYLRNRQLKIGNTETLHIFDSETYADVPVEILRRETMRLPNFKEVKTVVVHPLQKTVGIFRRTGELLIWMTDDENHVPVRIETTIKLGKVTAELVDSEIKRKGDEKKKE